MASLISELEMPLVAIYAILNENIGVSVLGQAEQVHDLNFSELHGSPHSPKISTNQSRDSWISSAEDVSPASQLSPKKMSKFPSDKIQSESTSPVSNDNNILSVLDIYHESRGISTQLQFDQLANRSRSDNNTQPADTNDTVVSSYAKLFQIIGHPGKPIESLIVESTLHDIRPKKKAKALKPNQILCIKVWKEFLWLLRFAPAPEFVEGTYFIGSFLNHAHSDVVYEVSNAIMFIFDRYSYLRLGMLNGFANFLKANQSLGDIAIYSVVAIVSRLTRMWILSCNSAMPTDINKEAVYRVSCKLDAVMMLSLTRANSKIRNKTIQILTDINELNKMFAIGGVGMPIAELLSLHEVQISKQGIYSYLDKSAQGHLLSKKTAAGVKLPTFYQLAGSHFTPLFLFYYGQLALLFVENGRPKALRHTAKVIRAHLPNFISNTIGETRQDVLAHFSAFIVLAMALGAVPVILS